MIILTKDYTTNESTQSMMFHHQFSQMPSINAAYWVKENTGSTFDVLDEVKPDFFIVDAAQLNIDLAYYFCEQANQNIKTKIILHVDDSFKSLKHLQASPIYKDHVELIISNNKEIGFGKKRVVKIDPCADVNIQMSSMTYKIPTAYVVNNPGWVNLEIDKPESYHSLSCQNIPNVDICMPILHMAKIFDRYGEIIFLDINKFDQSFFNAIHACEKVYYFNNQPNDKLKEESVRLFGCDLNYNNKDNVNFDEVKKLVSEKHTGANRVKTLLSQMGINQSIFTEV